MKKDIIFIALICAAMFLSVLSLIDDGRINFKITLIHKFETPIKLMPQEIHEYLYIDYPEALQEQKEINAKLQREIDFMLPYVGEFRIMTEDLNIE